MTDTDNEEEILKCLRHLVKRIFFTGPTLVETGFTYTYTKKASIHMPFVTIDKVRHSKLDSVNNLYK